MSIPAPFAVNHTVALSWADGGGPLADAIFDARLLEARRDNFSIVFGQHKIMQECLETIIVHAQLSLSTLPELLHFLNICRLLSCLA